MEVKFSDNIEAAAKVVDRAGSAFVKKAGGRSSLMMDLCAADGVNGNPRLDFDRLLAADDFNFMHDVAGIVRHMCRETGRLQNFFLPRFTVKK